MTRRNATLTASPDFPSGTAEVQTGQVYTDRSSGRSMIVTALTTGLPGTGVGDCAIIRSEDGHPNRTGVVSTSRLRGKSYTLAAVIAALALTATAQGAPAVIDGAPSVEMIAPGGNITSVVQQTAAHGWPHLSTQRERRDVAMVVLLSTNARSVRCGFGQTIAWAACATKRGKASRSYAVKVWEDGSYRIIRR